MKFGKTFYEAKIQMLFMLTLYLVWVYCKAKPWQLLNKLFQKDFLDFEQNFISFDLFIFSSFVYYFSL